MVDFAEIKKVLKTGSENGITRAELAKMFNTTEREITLAVTDARMKGEMVLSGNSGFYLPATDSEVLRFYNRFRAMSISNLTALKATRAYLKERNLLPKGR